MSELDDKIDEILKDTTEYDKILSELGDSYIASGEMTDDKELADILNEYGNGGSSENTSVIKVDLSTGELMAVKDGSVTSAFEIMDIKNESEETEDDDKSADEEKTAVFNVSEPVSAEYKENEEPDEYEKINEKIIKEKEEKFFGKNARIRDNIFNWEKDKDLRVPSKDSVGLAEGQVSFLSKDESEQDRKLTGYFTDIYDENDLKENLRKLHESTQPKTAENNGSKFTAFMDKMFNEPDSDEEPITDETVEEATVDDYDDPEMVSGIAEDLKIQKRQAMVRIIFAFVVSAVLLLIDIIISSGAELPKVINYRVNPVGFGIAEILLLTAVLACGIRSFFSGIVNIFRLRPSNDSIPSLAATVTFIGLLVIMFSDLSSSTVITFTGVVALNFTVNLFAKYLRLCCMASNYSVASQNGVKHIVMPVASFSGCSNYDTAAAIMRSDRIKGFMNTVSAYDGTEMSNRILIPVMLGAVIVSAVISAANGHNAVGVLSFAMNASALASLFVSSFAAVWSSYTESKRLAGYNAAVLSLVSANMLDSIDNIVVRDTELFPQDSIRITAMKIFNEEKTYETIMLSSALWATVGGPAAAAFAKLGNSNGTLPAVENLSIREGIGISADVGGKRIYSGIPSYIKSLDIDCHGIDFAAAYIKSGSRLIAIADDSQLLAVFALNYTGSKNMKKALTIFRDNGFSFTVCTDDPNITQQMIKDRYKLENIDITLVGSVHDNSFFRVTKDKAFVNAGIVSAGGPMGTAAAVESALRYRRTVRITDIIRIIATATGAALSVFLAATGSISFFGAAAVMVFQAIWFAVVAIVIYLRL